MLDLDSADAADGDDVVPGSDTVEEAPESGERARLRAWPGRPTRCAATRTASYSARSRSCATCSTTGFSPVVFCRYIATAEYVADELRKRLTAASR